MVADLRRHLLIGSTTNVAWCGKSASTNARRLAGITRFVPAQTGRRATDDLNTSESSWQGSCRLRSQLRLWYERRAPTTTSASARQRRCLPRSTSAICAHARYLLDASALRSDPIQPGYWRRLKELRDICDHRGPSCSPNYFQHNISNAAIGRLPWRAANNINDRLPEPPFYAGDKRIFRRAVLHVTHPSPPLHRPTSQVPR